MPVHLFHLRLLTWLIQGRSQTVGCTHHPTDPALLHRIVRQGRLAEGTTVGLSPEHKPGTAGPCDVVVKADFCSRTFDRERSMLQSPKLKKVAAACRQVITCGVSDCGLTPAPSMVTSMVLTVLTAWLLRQLPETSSNRMHWRYCYPCRAIGAPCRCCVLGSHRDRR